MTLNDNLGRFRTHAVLRGMDSLILVGQTINGQASWKLTIQKVCTGLELVCDLIPPFSGALGGSFLFSPCRNILPTHQNNPAPAVLSVHTKPISSDGLYHSDGKHKEITWIQ